jgi:galactosamine-6-phosphate isomerase
MKVTYFDSYETMSRQAGELIAAEIAGQKNLLLCAATGRSPEGAYMELVRHSKEGDIDVSRIRIIKLDEWGGVPHNHPVSCENYLRHHLLDPLGIPGKNYISFASDPPDLQEECNRIRLELESQGHIDLCILGLGTNGHLGLNEPGPSLEPYCHIARLSQETLQHQMIASLKQKPVYGLTLGMMELLSSKKIILLITGQKKGEVIERLLTKKISSDLPASLLWLHQDVQCMIDSSCLT